MSSNLPYRGKGEDDRAGDIDEEDEEVDATGYKTVRDAVLFAIEVSESMLKQPGVEDSKKADSNSPLSAALKCAHHLMQQRIISTPKDYMGILLYGTKKTKFTNEDESSRGGWSFPNCYPLIDLDVPEAEDVKMLKALVENDFEGSEDLFDVAGEPVSMHTVLFCANQIFQQRAANFASRRLFIITDNDDPHATNRAFRAQATVRAKDLYDLGVVIELFPISTPEHTFDTKLFYDDIVYRSSASDPDALSHNPSALTDVDKSRLKAGTTDGISLLQSLLTSVSSRAAPKRALFSSVPLELGPNLKISVKGFLFYKHQKPARSCYVYLGADKPQIATGKSDVVAGDNTQRVEKVEVRKAFTFGGEQIVFTQDELKKLRNLGDPVIRIIGFRPVEQLPMWANIKASTYLYPSEEGYVGSTRVYSALHQKLMNDGLMGLTWFIPRRNATPIMAALIPTRSAETEVGDSNQAGVSDTGCPQGLHLIPLPFRDDIRDHPPSGRDQPVRASDELVDAMRPIIQQLNLPKGVFDPSRYPNPSLQWHYRILQALALDEDLPEQPEDKTVPKYRQIDKRIGNESVEWGNTLSKIFKEHLVMQPDAATTGSKRPASGSASRQKLKTEDSVSDATVGKKIKREVGDARGSGSVNDEHIRRLIEKNKLSSLTTNQLKEFCAIKKLPVGGKKADIIERVEEWSGRR